MGNAVVQFQSREAAPPQTFTMSELERVALAIAKGRLFGSDDPNAVLTLCMVAQAEGKHPGLVMQQYHIIKGKPAKKAEAMLVDFLAAGGRVVWNKLDDECADATFSHPQGGTVTINWTLARATKAGLLNNDTWRKYPRQMLRSRVVSEGVRTVYPGATSGMYVPEEVADFDDQPRSDTPATPEPKRARDLRAEAPKEIEPPAEDDYSATLVELEGIAGPGQADALAEAWAKIGKDARKALADELPRLKSLCEPIDDAPTGSTLAEQLGLDDPHPGDAKAAVLIAMIEEAIAVVDVDSLLVNHKADIEAMPPELGASIEIAADKRRQEIKAERAKAKEGVE
jgi:hypothetical protein